MISTAFAHTISTGGGAKNIVAQWACAILCLCLHAQPGWADKFNLKSRQLFNFWGFDSKTCEHDRHI